MVIWGTKNNGSMAWDNLRNLFKSVANKQSINIINVTLPYFVSADVILEISAYCMSKIMFKYI